MVAVVVAVKGTVVVVVLAAVTAVVVLVAVAVVVVVVVALAAVAAAAAELKKCWMFPGPLLYQIKRHQSNSSDVLLRHKHGGKDGYGFQKFIPGVRKIFCTHTHTHTLSRYKSRDRPCPASMIAHVLTHNSLNPSSNIPTSDIILHGRTHRQNP